MAADSVESSLRDKLQNSVIRHGDPPQGKICTTWEGTPLPTELHAHIWLSSTPDVLEIQWDAPRWNSLTPDSPPKAYWKLWEYDVIEFFFLGKEEQYIEIEVAPSGHYLCLQMRGRRRPLNRMMPLSPKIESIGPHRWRGSVQVPKSFCPSPILYWNAYTIHAEGGTRIYSAMNRGTGQPDFHQLESFAPYPSSIR